MKQRDLELLSSYLDGQLSPSDNAHLETRLKTDSQLASVLNDLRATRTLLRKLPARKAPLNFTLTRKMVGQNPPLPRAYPLFRFATALATLLFVFSFGLNSFGRQMANPGPGFGMGGGGGDVTSQESTELYSAEAPVAAEMPATEAPAEEPPAGLVPSPTQMLTETTNTARTAEETPTSKIDGAADAFDQSQPAVASEPQNPAPLVSPTWQFGLAIVALLGALLMVLMRQRETSRWR